MNTSAEHRLIEEATEAAKAVVQKNLTETGLAASIDGYPQVWARDSMITLLGAAVEKDGTALRAFRITLDLLAGNQDRFGQVPCLVHLKDRHVEFGASDANPWFVIGTGYYTAITGDTAWAAHNARAILRALDWCEGRDIYRDGLMDSGECSDWADLLSHHGRVLFSNVLYVGALQAATAMLHGHLPEEAQRLRERSRLVRDAIQDHFWVRMHGTLADQTHGQVRQLMSVSLRRRPYFLPWVTRFDYGEHFDVAGNLLAILIGVATPAQSNAILDYIEQVGLNRPYPIRVLHPPMLPGERDWRDYYKIFNLNLPHQYHNGGIWPWVGGLYIAALVKANRRAQAQAELPKLAESLRLGTEAWECNEWLHGETGRPMGAKYQAWSAGMFLYARHAVATGQTPGLSFQQL